MFSSVEPTNKRNREDEEGNDNQERQVRPKTIAAPDSQQATELLSSSVLDDKSIGQSDAYILQRPPSSASAAPQVTKRKRDSIEDGSETETDEEMQSRASALPTTDEDAAVLKRLWKKSEFAGLYVQAGNDFRVTKRKVQKNTIENHDVLKNLASLLRRCVIGDGWSSKNIESLLQAGTIVDEAFEKMVKIRQSRTLYCILKASPLFELEHNKQVLDKYLPGIRENLANKSADFQITRKIRDAIQREPDLTIADAKKSILPAKSKRAKITDNDMESFKAYLQKEDFISLFHDAGKPFRKKNTARKAAITNKKDLETMYGLLAICIQGNGSTKEEMISKLETGKIIEEEFKKQASIRFNRRLYCLLAASRLSELEHNKAILEKYLPIIKDSSSERQKKYHVTKMAKAAMEFQPEPEDAEDQHDAQPVALAAVSATQSVDLESTADFPPQFLQLPEEKEQPLVIPAASSSTASIFQLLNVVPAQESALSSTLAPQSQQSSETTETDEGLNLLPLVAAASNPLLEADRLDTLFTAATISSKR